MTSRLAAVVDQSAKGGEQFVDVVEMQAGRRFVEDKKRFRFGFLRQMRGEFDALGFAAAQGRRRLSEPQIAEVRPLREPLIY